MAGGLDRLDLLADLNEPQREACLQTSGPLLILAGAGSGKTRTLTYRIAHLIQNVGVDPGAILGFTFTNKAAREMIGRIEGLLGPASRGMWLGTFHAVAVRILRRDIDRLGYDRRFLIFDADDQRALMRQVLRDLNIDEKKFPPVAVLSVLSRAKNAFVPPSAWHDESASGRVYGRAYRAYQDRLKQLNALDFDDLIYLAVRLFDEHPDILAGYHRRFQHVLVDEYQDTNPAQYRLIELLARGSGNLCVVGDDDQAIYGWRGADLRNILEFQKTFPEARVIRLEENYRSTKVILDAANAVVGQNQGRLGKKLWTSRGDGEKVRFHLAPDEESEAWHAAEIIHEAVGRGRSPADCAVLYRTNSQSRTLEMALARAGIPYRLVGGKRFYERKEVKDLLAYLRVLYNPLDAVSLARIVNFPRRGIGDVAIAHLNAATESLSLPLYQVLGDAPMVPGLTPPAQKAALELYRMFEHWRAEPSPSLADLVGRVAEESGLLDYFKSEGGRESDDRVENLGELISEAKHFEEVNGESDLGEFLNWVALVSDWEATDEREGGVWLMTVHAAKGLEFPVVVLVGLEENIFPHVRALEENGLEEERRLFYVAITRARDELYLSAAETRTQMGRTEANRLSRFVGEIPPELLARTDSSRAATASRAARREVPAEGYRLGERVRHPRFGWGQVVSQRGSGEDLEINIAFPGGDTRAFLAKYAQLDREQAE